MKHSAIIVAIVFCTTVSFGQTSKEKDFSLTLKKVVAALSTRDSASLSKYINRGTGVYILNRPGVMNTYKHFRTLGFSDATYPNLPFYDGVKLTPLKYTRLPTYDCEKWTKTGTFVDTTQTDHLLSTIAKNLNKEFKNEVPAKTINEFYQLENKSRRIVIAENNGHELIIYLSFINNKWVLTIIDKVTGDCST
jgi:hypothetical protein